METFLFALIVFCATIFLAYSGELKCYKCGKVESNYTKYSREQCETDQEETPCGNSTVNSTEQACFRVWGKNSEDEEIEVRGCTEKSVCEALKGTCSDDAKKKAANLKECDGTCCKSDLCNSYSYSAGFTVSTNMLMMMLGLLCSAMLF